MKKIHLALLALFACLMFSLPASAQHIAVRVGPGYGGPRIGAGFFRPGPSFRMGIGFGAGFNAWAPGIGLPAGYGCVDAYGYPVPCVNGYASYYGPWLNYGYGRRGYFPGFYDYSRSYGPRYSFRYYGGSGRYGYAGGGYGRGSYGRGGYGGRGGRR
jgi:hypothetical protein